MKKKANTSATRSVIFAGIVSLAVAAGGFGQDESPDWLSPDYWAQFNLPFEHPPTVNAGVTAAGVRMWFADNVRVRRWYFPYRILDLNQIGHYHEFIYCEGGVRIVFTTEAAVRDFKVLGLAPNENKNWREDGERIYSTTNILYTLPYLRPELPFAITVPPFLEWGVDIGFSFAEEGGAQRYFTMGFNHRLVLFEIFEF